MNKSLFLAVLLVVLAAHSGDFTKVSKCGPLEVFLECASICNDCIQRDSCRPLIACQPGCNCQKGYFRDHTGKCIPESKCPNFPICGGNEEFSECVSPCNDCEIRGKCNFLVCNRGCDCIKGYHRDSTGFCVPASQCPIRHPSKCPARNKNQYDDDEGSNNGLDVEL